MSFRVNFFPIPYILALILLISFVTVFNETVYIYLSSNFIINGAICVLFVFCTVWILGSLSYFSRSARLFSRLLRSVGPVVERKPVRKNGKEIAGKVNKSMVLKSSSPIAGTLFDSPVVSSMLAKMERKNKLEVSKSDADEIAQTIVDNAARVLAPSRFVASIFILCGLVGTFLGLLDTIGGVAKALESLADGGLTSDIGAFIKMLSDPLQGMSTAFSASLFGLGSALVSNFGNYLAWERVLGFAGKVRNYLMSNTGVFDEDPVRITARDLLISLEESFDTLYRGLTDRLELLTKHIASMGSVIVKTHERQEKMLKVILKDHELMEQFWRKFLLGTEGVTMIIDEMVRKLAVVLPESMRKVFAPVLEVMLEVADNNSRMLERAVALAGDMVAAQADMVDVGEEITDAIAKNADILMQINSSMVTVESRLNLEEIAGLIDQGNVLKSNMANLISEGNGLGEELNAINSESNLINRDVVGAVDNGSRLAETILSSIDQGNALAESMIKEVGVNTVAVNQVAGAVIEGNNISAQISEFSNVSNAIAVDVKAAIDEGNSLAQNVLSEVAQANNLNNVIIGTINDGNAIASGVSELIAASNGIAEANNGMTEAMLGELGASNAIANDTLALLDGMLLENNELSRNILNVLDERLGMIIGFSRDLLINADNSLMSLNEFKGRMVAYYEQLNLAARIDNLAELSASTLNVVSNELSVMSDLYGMSGNTFGLLSDNSNVVIAINEAVANIANNLNSVVGINQEMLSNIMFNNDISSQIVGGISQASLQLDGINNNVVKFFDDSSNFRTLYVEMERQINGLVGLFAQFQNKFDALLNNAAMSSETLNGVNSAVAEVVTRVGVVGELLSGVAGTLNTLGSVNYEHKELTSMIYSGIEGIIRQEESLNENIKNLSAFFEGGLARVVESIGGIGSISFEFAQMVNKMMENLIANTNNIPLISNKVEGMLEQNKAIFDGSQNSSQYIAEQINKVESKLIDINAAQSSYSTLSQENKNILSNLDNNISGIGNITSSLNKTIDDLNNSINFIVDQGDKSLEKQEAIQAVFEITNNNMKQIADNIKGDLGGVSSALESVNVGMDNVTDILTNMEKALLDVRDNSDNTKDSSVILQSNNEVLENIKNEINSLVELQKNAHKDVNGTFTPILTALGDALYQVIDKLDTMSKVVENNKAVYTTMNSGNTANSNNATTEQYGNISKVIDSLSNEFKGLTKYVADISNSIADQRGMINQLGSNISNLSATTRDLTDLSFNFKDVVGSMMSMKDIVSSLHDKISSKDTYVYEVTDKLANDLKNVSQVIDRLGSGFIGEIEKISYNNKSLFDGISNLTAEFSQLNRGMSGNGNAPSGQELVRSISSLNANVDAIKSVISSTLNSKLSAEISKISENQQDLNLKINKVMPYIDELVRSVKNIGGSDGGVSHNIVNIANSLDDIKNTDINNNLKLDLLVKAIDTLISEMLNSRGVSQAILDIIAELGGFKKIR